MHFKITIFIRKITIKNKKQISRFGVLVCMAARFSQKLEFIHRDSFTDLNSNRKLLENKSSLDKPWMHCKAPSSVRMVNVSPGFTWTRITCKKKKRQDVTHIHCVKQGANQSL